MATTPTSGGQDVRYEPDERPPLPLTIGLGLQYVALTVAGVVLSPVILVGTVGGSEAYMSWVVFAALVVCGATTVIQVARVGRIGSGYLLLMGSSSAFLAICVAALERGGGGLLASLLIVSSLCQFLLAARLSLFRKIFTPTVAGTVLMLIPITLSALILRKLTDVPADASDVAAPVTAAVTLGVIAAISIRGTGVWRLWAAALGIVAGCAVGGLAYGIYDTERVLEASWIGLPALAWPGIDLGFGPEFWALLPVFVILTLVSALDTIGDGIAIQRISWRRPRAIDFQSIQGALAADGLGNLLSGLMGTVPNTTYVHSIAVADLTRVTARAVGVCVGVMFVVIAFLPKLVAVIVAMPGPVVAAYLVVIVASLFMLGVRILVHDGLDYRKGVAVGLAFWLGIAFELDWIFPELLQGVWNDLFGNGLTVGGVTVIMLTQFVELTRPRPKRLKTELSLDNFPKIDAFLAGFAARGNRDREMTGRLRAVGEELLLTLARQDDAGGAAATRHLLLVARDDADAVELEFAATTDDENLEDRLAVLGDAVVGHPVEEEMSLRLLRHYASSVHHQQFHDTDVITVRVGPPRSM
ncbi:MAG: purine/pyrimidine permease [Acidobacteria bacterium]|nr:purine/pyrimidine permease [Acidobacteriota bacterium]